MRLFVFLRSIKCSDEHSLECQGGPYAPSGTYSPPANDIWSLGIILLNLCTGRNPWSSATSTDATFLAYLASPTTFLPSVLPISAALNDLLVSVLDLDWSKRLGLDEFRVGVIGIQNFLVANCNFAVMYFFPMWFETVQLTTASTAGK